VAFTASLLIFTFCSWYCGLFHIPVQLALIPFIILVVFHAYRREYALAGLRQEWRWVLVFLVFFLLMLDVRFVNPTISYAEKFMDHAFLASVMRAPIVPPLDPWFAGGTLNVYYYLGYWIFGCLGIVSGVPSNVAFNLALPTVLGVSAVTLYAVGTLLLTRFRWLPLLVFFIPNPSFFYLVFQGNGLNSIIWDSTRTITNTINEYPLFSFIWGDLHAHVISIFNQIFLLFILIFVYKRWETLDTRGRWCACIFAALSLGSMPLINTWDVLIYAPITLLFAFLVAWRNRADIRAFSSWQCLITVPLIALVCYLPFYLILKANTGSIAIVREPSEPFQFLLVNGIFIVIFFLLLIRDIGNSPLFLLVFVPFALAGYPAAGIAAVPLVYFILKKDRDVAEILAIIGLLLLVIVEFLYLDDNMGETYFRMNTVFKCYLPAWIILGTAAFTMVAGWFSKPGRVPEFPPRKTAIATVFVVAVFFVLPFYVPLDLNYGSRSLDGLAYLDTAHPGDAGAVAWLRALPGDERLVEAEGGDYTYFSRVSSFTGIPAVIGMPFHEYMWRADDTGWYTTRVSDIRTLYEQPDQTVPLMKKYNVTLLYVGDTERARYDVNISTAGLHLVYSDKGTEIYRLSG
jgi:YYY domain-containing protein